MKEKLSMNDLEPQEKYHNSIMFGAFRATASARSGLLWKIPHTMSQPQKYRHRKRLESVDNVIETVFSGLKSTKQEAKNLETKYEHFPKVSEMKTVDKYTVFNKNEKGYRKSIHRTPKWTKVSQRVNPKYF